MHNSVIPGTFSANVSQSMVRPSKYPSPKKYKSVYDDEYTETPVKRKQTFAEFLMNHGYDTQDEFINDITIDYDEYDDDDEDIGDINEYSEFDDVSDEPSPKLVSVFKYEEEQENVHAGSKYATKIDRARLLFQQLIHRSDLARRDIIDEFVNRLDVTQSTAVSYYERLAKEAGLTNKDSDDTPNAPNDYKPFNIKPSSSRSYSQSMLKNQEELDDNELTNNSEEGITRTIDNAHLVYKRKMKDGAFEELWIYNITDKLNDALSIRRAILAGTDIPRGHTRSENGKQEYTLYTLGNAQMLHITGLSN